jgi:hypothetical protein
MQRTVPSSWWVRPRLYRTCGVSRMLTGALAMAIACSQLLGVDDVATRSGF